MSGFSASVASSGCEAPASISSIKKTQKFQGYLKGNPSKATNIHTKNFQINSLILDGRLGDSVLNLTHLVSSIFFEKRLFNGVAVGGDDVVAAAAAAAAAARARHQKNSAAGGRIKILQESIGPSHTSVRHPLSSERKTQNHHLALRAKIHLGLCPGTPGSNPPPPRGWLLT